MSEQGSFDFAGYVKDGEEDAGMFPRLKSSGLLGEPSAEEMEKQAEAARYSKIVLLKGVHVKSFNLSLKPDEEAYTKLYTELYAKSQKAEVLIKDYQKEFINHAGTAPYYLVHLEWWEYELEVTDHMKGQEEEGHLPPQQSPVTAVQPNLNLQTMEANDGGQ